MKHLLLLAILFITFSTQCMLANPETKIVGLVRLSGPVEPGKIEVPIKISELDLRHLISEHTDLLCFSLLAAKKRIGNTRDEVDLTEISTTTCYSPSTTLIVCLFPQ